MGEDEYLKPPSVVLSRPPWPQPLSTALGALSQFYPILCPHVSRPGCPPPPRCSPVSHFPGFFPCFALSPSPSPTQLGTHSPSSRHLHPIRDPYATGCVPKAQCSSLSLSLHSPDVSCYSRSPSSWQHWHPRCPWFIDPTLPQPRRGASLCCLCPVFIEVGLGLPCSGMTSP